jgi:hypothetical protein
VIQNMDWQREFASFGISNISPVSHNAAQGNYRVWRDWASVWGEVMEADLGPIPHKWNVHCCAQVRTNGGGGGGGRGRGRCRCSRRDRGGRGFRRSGACGCRCLRGRPWGRGGGSTARMQTALLPAASLHPLHPAAQFMVSKARILRHRRAFYARIYHWLQDVQSFYKWVPRTRTRKRTRTRTRICHSAAVSPACARHFASFLPRVCVACAATHSSSRRV